MKTKARLLFLFVPGHAFVTLLTVPLLVNSPSGGGSILVKGLAAAVASPVLPPLVRFDPEGDRRPDWCHVAAVPFHSLVWGLGWIPLSGLGCRLVGPHRHSEDFQPPNS